ncbi:MAG: signal peptidase I [Oscillospiraceae bacterium]|jgi:signal peptidase I|nr:signal peptidase I [Oscillospiraceae bacterium]
MITPEAPKVWLRRRDGRRVLGTPLRLTLAFLVLVLAAHLLLFDIRPVRGHSMAPILKEGQWVLIFKPAYVLSAPDYGQLVVCTFPGQRDLWIKRVLGRPGDMLRAQGGLVYRNGQPLAESYLFRTNTPDFPMLKAWDGQYLLLGDNRAESVDSRDPSLGAVPDDLLTGRAVLVIWPPSAWRTL